MYTKFKKVTSKICEGNLTNGIKTYPGTFILLTAGCFHSMIFFMFPKKSFILSLIVDRDDDEYV